MSTSTTLSALELTRELVRTDTVNPPGSEHRCCKYLGQLLEQAGFRVAYDEFAPGRTSLVATLGDASAGAPICFSGHVDTVPFGAKPWTHEPLGAELDGDRLYGRGTTDMKGGVAAMVVAALRLAPSLRASRGVVLVLTAGEETSCQGAAHLAERPEVLGRAGAIVVGEPTSNFPYIGHKGTLWIEATTRGVTAHASMPERGVNAIYKAAKAVRELETLVLPGGPHPVMGKATLSVGTIVGGVAVNSVPDQATVGIDIRSVPGVSHADVVDLLHAKLGADVELKVTADDLCLYTDPNHEWVQQVYDIVTPILGARPEARTICYFTDGASLSKAYGGAPTVILGPGDAELAHQTDEYCRVRRIEEAVEIYANLMAAWQTRPLR